MVGSGAGVVDDVKVCMAMFVTETHEEREGAVVSRLVLEDRGGAGCRGHENEDESLRCYGTVQV